MFHTFTQTVTDMVGFACDFCPDIASPQFPPGGRCSGRENNSIALCFGYPASDETVATECEENVPKHR